MNIVIGKLLIQRKLELKNDIYNRNKLMLADPEKYCDLIFYYDLLREWILLTTKLKVADPEDTKVEIHNMSYLLKKLLQDSPDDMHKDWIQTIEISNEYFGINIPKAPEIHMWNI